MLNPRLLSAFWQKAPSFELGQGRYFKQSLSNCLNNDVKKSLEKSLETGCLCNKELKAKYDF